VFFYPNKELKDCCCGGGGFALAAIIPIVGADTGAGFGFSPVSPPRSANGSFLLNMLKKTLWQHVKQFNSSFYFMILHQISTKSKRETKLTNDLQYS
jgi:hypothetical protein